MRYSPHSSERVAAAGPLLVTTVLHIPSEPNVRLGPPNQHWRRFRMVLRGKRTMGSRSVHDRS